MEAAELNRRLSAAPAGIDYAAALRPAGGIFLPAPGTGRAGGNQPARNATLHSPAGQIDEVRSAVRQQSFSLLKKPGAPWVVLKEILDLPGR